MRTKYIQIYGNKTITAGDDVIDGMTANYGSTGTLALYAGTDAGDTLLGMFTPTASTSYVLYGISHTSGIYAKVEGTANLTFFIRTSDL